MNTIAVFTKNKVRTVITTLENSSACHGSISAFMVKNTIIMQYLDPLTYLVSQMIYTGVFPDELKLKIIPLFKSMIHMKQKQIDLFRFYHFFSKVNEKLVHNHVMNFISKYKLLCDYQFDSSCFYNLSW